MNCFSSIIAKYGEYRDPLNFRSKSFTFLVAKDDCVTIVNSLFNEEFSTDSKEEDEDFSTDSKDEDNLEGKEDGEYYSSHEDIESVSV